MILPILFIAVLTGAMFGWIEIDLAKAHNECKCIAPLYNNISDNPFE